jgi:hypothetical protein
VLGEVSRLQSRRHLGANRSIVLQGRLIFSFLFSMGRAAREIVPRKRSDPWNRMAADRCLGVKWAKNISPAIEEGPEMLARYLSKVSCLDASRRIPEVDMNAHVALQAHTNFSPVLLSALRETKKKNHLPSAAIGCCDTKVVLQPCIRRQIPWQAVVQVILALTGGGCPCHIRRRSIGIMDLSSRSAAGQPLDRATNELRC